MCFSVKAKGSHYKEAKELHTARGPWVANPWYCGSLVESSCSHQQVAEKWQDRGIVGRNYRDNVKNINTVTWQSNLAKQIKWNIICIMQNPNLHIFSLVHLTKHTDVTHSDLGPSNQVRRNSIRNVNSPRSTDQRGQTAVKYMSLVQNTTTWQ